MLVAVFQSLHLMKLNGWEEKIFVLLVWLQNFSRFNWIEKRDLHLNTGVKINKFIAHSNLFCFFVAINEPHSTVSSLRRNGKYQNTPSTTKQFLNFFTFFTFLSQSFNDQNAEKNRNRVKEVKWKREKELVFASFVLSSSFIVHRSHSLLSSGQTGFWNIFYICHFIYIFFILFRKKAKHWQIHGEGKRPSPDNA